MNIDFDALARLIEMTSRSPIHSLTLQEGNQTITLVNHSLSNHSDQVAPMPHANPTTPAPQNTPQNTAPSTKHTLCSPMLGTFYRKPSQDASDFVQIGDSVSIGDTLCIVEAMKIMHEVKADKEGVVQDILANDGQMVEYDTPLFVIT